MKRVYELYVYKLAEELSDMVWQDFDKKHEGQISNFQFQCSVNAYNKDLFSVKFYYNHRPSDNYLSAVSGIGKYGKISTNVLIKM